MRDLIDHMLAMLDRRSWSIAGSGDNMRVTLAGTRIDIDTSARDVDLSLEKLAETIKAAIARERAEHMIEAACVGTELPPMPRTIVVT